MKIFIFGSNGMLGTYVTKYLSQHLDYQIIPLTRSDYDISNLTFDNLSKFLTGRGILKNDLIINCAGLIPQRTLPDGKLYYKINSLFPVLLGVISHLHSCQLIHITTDCVFNGKLGPYDENSAHDETNIYGISKSVGELTSGTIIRTSIIGEELSNKKSLLEWVRTNAGGKINGFTDHLWNGVTCLELSKIIGRIIKENLYWKGVRHVFSPHTVSKYELVQMINESYKLGIDVRPLETNDNIDKSLITIYPPIFEIPDLKKQIEELKNYQF